MKRALGLSVLLLTVSASGSGIKDKCAGMSQRIKSITDADQADRRDWHKMTTRQHLAVIPRDESRRVQIAEIFAKGCFRTADDYEQAALVFQHGSVPDHYLQAALWAQRAIQLGHADDKSLAAIAIDRYLESNGYKQLYASQSSASDATHGCYCLWPVEETATDEDRKKMGRGTIADALKEVERANAGKKCPAAAICQDEAKPVPKGSIPGIPW